MSEMNPTVSAEVPAVVARALAAGERFWITDDTLSADRSRVRRVFWLEIEGEMRGWAGVAHFWAKTTWLGCPQPVQGLPEWLVPLLSQQQRMIDAPARPEDPSECMRLSDAVSILVARGVPAEAARDVAHRWSARRAELRKEQVWDDVIAYVWAARGGRSDYMVDNVEIWAVLAAEISGVGGSDDPIETKGCGERHPALKCHPKKTSPAGEATTAAVERAWAEAGSWNIVLVPQTNGDLGARRSDGPVFCVTELIPPRWRAKLAADMIAGGATGEDARAWGEVYLVARADYHRRESA